MPQHGRHNAGAPDEPIRRFGGISVETALVLALIILIGGGSLLVHTLLPSKRETETVVGDKKVRVTQVGKGGVLPGPIEPRTIVPVVAPAPVATVAAPLPVRTKKPKPIATAVPTATTAPGGVINPLPGGGGGGGGGGQTCTILILCKPGETPAATADPGGSGQPDATPAPTSAVTPAPTPKKKKKSTTAPAAARAAPPSGAPAGEQAAPPTAP